MRSFVIWPVLLAFALVFGWGTHRLSSIPPRQPPLDSLVAMPPILLLGLYGGDRYLAADIETARLMGEEVGSDQAAGLRYYRMAHEAISLLNPCQEDNYYVANAMLAWGGEQDSAFRILKRATECRFWDDWPPFFYGYNQFFFNHDSETASRYLQIAADRKGDNQVMFQNLAFMMKTKTMADTRQAVRFLRAQQSAAKDARLRRALGYRIGRLEGLIVLEDAANAYLARFGTTLPNPNELIQKGVISAFPQDPLGVGYSFDFSTGKFSLRSISPNGK